MLCAEGFHRVETDYDLRDQVVEERWFDRNGSPTPGPDGCVRKLQPRDARGAATGEQCLKDEG